MDSSIRSGETMANRIILPLLEINPCLEVGFKNCYIDSKEQYVVLQYSAYTFEHLTNHPQYANALLCGSDWLVLINIAESWRKTIYCLLNRQYSKIEIEHIHLIGMYSGLNYEMSIYEFLQYNTDFDLEGVKIKEVAPTVKLVNIVLNAALTRALHKLRQKKAEEEAKKKAAEPKMDIATITKNNHNFFWAMFRHPVYKKRCELFLGANLDLIELPILTSTGVMDYPPAKKEVIDIEQFIADNQEQIAELPITAALSSGFSIVSENPVVLDKSQDFVPTNEIDFDFD